DAWVRENIGLTFETFTSSVLLMQGKAEKLLSAPPKERFEVLAGIVDLNRYQRLHKRADEKRRAMQAHAESLQRQLDALPEVNDAELIEVEHRIEVAQGVVQQSRTTVEQLQRLTVQAEGWAR